MMKDRDYNNIHSGKNRDRIPKLKVGLDGKNDKEKKLGGNSGRRVLENCGTLSFN